MSFSGKPRAMENFCERLFQEKNPCVLHFWWRPLLFFSSYTTRRSSYLPQICCSFLLNEARGTKGGNLGFLWYFSSPNATSKNPKRVQCIVYRCFKRFILGSYSCFMCHYEQLCHQHRQGACWFAGHWINPRCTLGSPSCFSEIPHLEGNLEGLPLRTCLFTNFRCETVSCGVI